MTPRWPALVACRAAVAASVLLFVGTARADEGPGAALIRGPDVARHVTALADDAFEGREAGTRGGQAAGAYIVDAIAPLGLVPAGDAGTHFQRFGAMRNVLALLPGDDPAVADELVVVGGHYDHVGYGSAVTSNGGIGAIHNGADDNASGAAGLIAIAAALAEAPRRPRRSVVIAWWDGEEKGLLGSTHFLRVRPARLAGLRPVFSLNLDMIGRLRDGRVEVYGSRSGTGFREHLVHANTATGLRLAFDWSLVDDSDHYPFIVAGIPSLFLHTGLHEQYHRPDDDTPLVDAEGLARVSRLALQVVLGIADGLAPPPAFRGQCRAEASRRGPALPVPPAETLPVAPRGVFPPWGIATRVDPAEPRVPVIVAVTRDSPMERGGIRPDDRLMEIAGVPAAGHQAALNKLRGAGRTIELAVEREGRMFRITAQR